MFKLGIQNLISVTEISPPGTYFRSNYYVLTGQKIPVGVKYLILKKVYLLGVPQMNVMSHLKICVVISTGRFEIKSKREQLSVNHVEWNSFPVSMFYRV